MGQKGILSKSLDASAALLDLLQLGFSKLLQRIL